MFYKYNVIVHLLTRQKKLRLRIVCEVHANKLTGSCFAVDPILRTYLRYFDIEKLKKHMCVLCMYVVVRKASPVKSGFFFSFL